jgi:hypothetical protein
MSNEIKVNKHGLTRYSMCSGFEYDTMEEDEEGGFYSVAEVDFKMVEIEQRNAELVEALINAEERIQDLEQELFNDSDFDEGN